METKIKETLNKKRETIDVLCTINDENTKHIQILTRQESKKLREEAGQTLFGIKKTTSIKKMEKLQRKQNNKERKARLRG